MKATNVTCSDKELEDIRSIMREIRATGVTEAERRPIIHADLDDQSMDSDLSWIRGLL